MSFLNDMAYRFTIAPRLKRLKRLLPEAKIYPAGSRYVCSPPSWFTDVDFLVHAEDDIKWKLLWAGYKESHYTERYFGAGDDFTAWRKRSVNLIVTSKQHYADSFNTATHICKSRNVLTKWHRVIVHQTLRGDQQFNVYHQVLESTLRDLLTNFISPHRKAIIAAYRAKHGLIG